MIDHHQARRTLERLRDASDALRAALQDYAEAREQIADCLPLLHLDQPPQPAPPPPIDLREAARRVTRAALSARDTSTRKQPKRPRAA